MKKPAPNLEERVSVYGERVIEFCYLIQLDAVLDPLIRQFVRSATSIGANYCEADEAQSKKDFRHKIAICRKETRETQYWLRMIAKACPAQRITARELWREGQGASSHFLRNHPHHGPQPKGRGKTGHLTYKLSTTSPIGHWSMVTGHSSLC